MAEPIVHAYRGADVTLSRCGKRVRKSSNKPVNCRLCIKSLSKAPARARAYLQQGVQLGPDHQEHVEARLLRRKRLAEQVAAVYREVGSLKQVREQFLPMSWERLHELLGVAGVEVRTPRPVRIERLRRDRTATKVLRFRCRRCGRLTSGRMPRRGDGSLRYPRDHRIFGGGTCPGVFEEADWVEVPVRAPRPSGE